MKLQANSTLLLHEAANNNSMHAQTGAQFKLSSSKGEFSTLRACWDRVCDAAGGGGGGGGAGFTPLTGQPCLMVESRVNARLTPPQCFLALLEG